MPNRGVSSIAGMLGLALCIVPIVIFDSTSPFPGLYAIIPCAGAVLIIYSGRKDGLAYRLLSTPILAGIGKISYSLYLWHWPVLVFTTYYYMRPLSATESIICIGITTILSYVSYRFVEIPFRLGISRYTGRHDVLLASIMILLPVVLGSVIILNKGFPTHETDELIVIESEILNQKTSVCFYLPEDGGEVVKTMTECKIKEGSAYPDGLKILLWGDSYANHYVSALSESLEIKSSAIYTQTHSGCPPFLNFYKEKCDSFNQAVLRNLANRDIDVVILSANWWTYSRDKNFFKDLSQVTSYLKERGYKVYVIGASPVYHSRVPHIAYRDHKYGTGLLEKYSIEFDASLDKNMEMAVSSNAAYFSPYQILCEGKECVFKIKNKLLHVDHGHLTNYGARLMITNFVAKFSELK